MLEGLQSCLEAGDAQGMLVAMFREVVGLPPGGLEMLRGQRTACAVRLGNAATAPRELGAERANDFQPDRVATMRAPTLLLVGGDSPPRELTHARGVAAALPDARVVILPRQQHTAMYAAPDVFVREVIESLDA